ncbi:MAG: hypothetical protein Fur0011_0670 [Candidatus Microgenomates bacterium]
MEDAKKYLPEPKYEAKYLEQYQAKAVELFKMFDTEGDEVWKKYFDVYKPAIKAFLEILDDPVDPELLSRFKEAIQAHATSLGEFDPYAKANRVAVNLDSLAPTESGSVVQRKPTDLNNIPPSSE